MNWFNDEFNWHDYLFLTTDNEESFDERVLYRQIKRKQTLLYHNAQIITTNRYSILLEFDSSLPTDVYRTILLKFFKIRTEHLDMYLQELKSKHHIEWPNLTEPISNLIMEEIYSYLKNHNYLNNIVKKKAV